MPKRTERVIHPMEAFAYAEGYNDALKDLKRELCNLPEFVSKSDVIRIVEELLRE